MIELLSFRWTVMICTMVNPSSHQSTATTHSHVADESIPGATSNMKYLTVLARNARHCRSEQWQLIRPRFLFICPSCSNRRSKHPRFDCPRVLGLLHWAYKPVLSIIKSWGEGKLPCTLIPQDKSVRTARQMIQKDIL